MAAGNSGTGAVQLTHRPSHRAVKNGLLCGQVLSFLKS
jgi:hypothetical protein